MKPEFLSLLSTQHLKVMPMTQQLGIALASYGRFFLANQEYLIQVVLPTTGPQSHQEYTSPY
jgi:hypothetical protein